MRKFTITKSHTLSLWLLMSLVVCYPATASTVIFEDYFTSATLDPAWTVNATGYNQYSLTANPGYLRYTVSPVTHSDGFLNGYAVRPPYNPATDLVRGFAGDQWLFETQVDYYIPLSNGKNQDLRIYFGDGSGDTYFVGISRHEDLCCGSPNEVLFEFVKNTGPGINLSWEQNAVLPGAGSAYYYRVEREYDVLSVSWSTNNISWNSAYVHDTLGVISGLDQQVVVSGDAWETPNGTYADYNYMTLVSPTVPIPPAVWLFLTGIGMLGLRWRR